MIVVACCALAAGLIIGWSRLGSRLAFASAAFAVGWKTTAQQTNAEAIKFPFVLSTVFIVLFLLEDLVECLWFCATAGQV